MHDFNERVGNWIFLNQREFVGLYFLSCYRSVEASLKKTKEESCAFVCFRCGLTAAVISPWDTTKGGRKWLLVIDR